MAFQDQKTEIPSSKCRQKIKIKDIFSHQETDDDDDVCNICSEANTLSEFISGEK
jgi:hypothetical protein